MKKLNSVTAYITLAAIIIHFILTPLLFTSVISYVKNGYQQQFVDNIRASTSLITSQLSQLDFQAEKEKIESLLDEILLSGQVSFMEISLNDEEVISSMNNMVEKSQFLEDFKFGEHEDQTYYLKSPFQDSSDMSLMLFVGYDELLIQEQIESSVERGVWIAVGYFFITIFSILIFVPRLTRPINSLRNSAQQVASGNSKKTFSVNTSIDEFSSLATDLEKMRVELITQTKAIQHRESYIRAIMEKMADPMIIMNEDFVIESTNTAAEKIFEYADVELIEHNFFTICALDKNRKLKDEIKTVIAAGNEEVIHCTGKTKNGKLFPIDLSFSKLVVFEHTIIICNIHDMTEYKKAEDKLIESREIAETANRAKSIFLSSMSHELRTPLNAIIGYSEILLEDAEDKKDTSTITDLQKIRSSGKHLLSLISNILDLSKIEAGKMELDIQEIEIGKMLEDVVFSTAPLIEKNKNHFRVENKSNQNILFSDVTKVKQILINLLSNAAKFTRNGTVSLVISDEVEGQQEYIQCQVSDTGIGISIEDQKNLFHEFSQANAKIVTEYGGTGLGLALSNKFCRMLGGDIGFQSELNNGSTFIVKIPTKYQHSEAKAG